MTNVSGEVDLDFQYQPSIEAQSEKLLMHETVGGGIAAIDFDLDGWTDLYFTQGGGSPLVPNGSKPNQLFRNIAGKVFSDVSQFTGTGDLGYGQGIAAADINQDGFLDLVVANFGPNVLLINNGDGTFRSRELAAELPGADAWTTSIACGDLTGDHLPDVIEVNYIDDKDMLVAVCSGTTDVPLCNPQRYRPALDRFLRNRGDGEMETWDATGAERPRGYGFAAIIVNFDKKAGNDLFVANDTDPNHFWLSQPGVEPSDGFKLAEQAQLLGCAMGLHGVAQSCMGIASGDFDHNGRIDFHVTNYTDESSDLFMQQSSGLFVNQFSMYGLDDATRAMLGWGTQAADFDNDGWLDLAIVNGNIYNHSKDGTPYRMPPQLIQGGSRSFKLVVPDAKADSFWTMPTLGRTLATLDWNRDGKPDFVASHLDVPVALLEKSPTAEIGFSWSSSGRPVNEMPLVPR